VSHVSGGVAGIPQPGPGVSGWSPPFVDDLVVVRLAGELDVSTAELRPLLLGAVECGSAATIVLDMSGVRFVDAHSIGVIVGAWAAAKARGRVLQVDGLQGLPARVFRLVGLEPVLVRSSRLGTSEGNAGGEG
jgi:anti-sigma B factor antagonist